MRAFVLVALLAAPASAEGPELQSVEVHPGDTLWSISQRYLQHPEHWDVILQHNNLPSADPTVALPGMTLKIPKSEIKEVLRAASLTERKNIVLLRRKDSPSWADAPVKGQLFDGDTLRTKELSWARVRFFSGAVMSLDENSMAIVRAPRQADHDLFLQSGTAHNMSARAITPSARIRPKSEATVYSAKVLENLTTLVQVHKGAAQVEDGQGKNGVVVEAGFFTNVPAGKAPEAPAKLPEGGALLGSATASAAPAGPGGISELFPGGRLAVGVPIGAYLIQLSKTEDFKIMVYENRFDADQRIDLKSLPVAAGDYWIRAAIIDLLGEAGAFSPPRPYRRASSRTAP